ncbi:MAG: type I restriction endonuclease subunit S [Gammaproteobacteria bacterium]|nr:MAG: type I restriction endonuclease subunit S [Gammaproteobacteria bacterium]
MARAAGRSSGNLPAARTGGDGVPGGLAEPAGVEGRVMDIMTRTQPAGWQLYRLGQLFDERKEKVSDKDFRPLSVTMQGIVPQLETAAKTDDGDNRKLVRAGDYVINSRSDRKGSGGISDYDGSVSLISIVLKPTRAIYPRFAHHLLRSPAFQEEFYRWGHGIVADLWTTRYADMKNIRLFVPDLPTQKAIADFLDRETARIDLLIEKKQRLVELVAEKETMTRDTFTVKGVSDNHLMPSGVEWFGDVPSHWVICRFNRLISSKVDYRGRTPEKVDEGVFLVTARNIRNGVIDYERSQEYTTEADWAALSARGLPEIGDVLFTTEAPLGQIAQVDRTDVAFAQRIIKFRANEAMVSNDYLAQFMMSSQFQRSLQLFSSGSTAAGIKSERMAHLFGLVPPKAEQAAIVSEMREEKRKLGGLIAPIQGSIDRLREFRAAFITAAVTGQIDPENWSRRGTTDRRLDQIEAEMGA